MARRPSVMERIGTRWLRFLARRLPPSAAGPCGHVLTAAQREHLARIRRRAIARAALIGGVGALAVATVEIWARALWPGQTTADLIGYWTTMGLGAGGITLLEVLLLHHQALFAIQSMAAVVGLDPFATEGEGDHAAVARALVRAAMEMPNPVDPSAGVDPLAERPRWLLVVFALVYKAKIGVTSFVVKLLVRRALGRAAVRTWLPLAAVPITAFWAAFVAARVLREARARLTGPSAVVELVERLPTPPGPAAADLGLQAVGAVIVASGDCHPNLVLLLATLGRRWQRNPAAIQHGCRPFLTTLGSAEDDHQVLALRCLAVAVAVDGRLEMAETRLLRRAHQACGRAPDLAPYRALARAFLAGEAMPTGILERVAG